MAYKKINKVYSIADTFADLALIPNPQMNDECFVIQDACEYKAMSTGEWVKQIPSSTNNGGNSEIDLSAYATIEYVDACFAQDEDAPSWDNIATKDELKDAIGNIQIPSTDDLASKEQVSSLVELITALYQPKKYEIFDVPQGTIVDYREKEIRVFCPENVEFKKQNVGATGNPNMYYMSMRAYAPKGAVKLNEGDQGVIVDSNLDFTGTDKYGRQYKTIWLALASYDEASDSWNYFGKTSNADKYIGWTYLIEWLDANGTIISADKFRVNLSNKDCHYLMAPYYGNK